MTIVANGISRTQSYTETNKHQQIRTEKFVYELKDRGINAKINSVCDSSRLKSHSTAPQSREISAFSESHTSLVLL